MTATIEARARLNGETMPLGDAALAVTDEGVARGDGAFETIGVWDGRPFRLDDHLERLDASLARIALPAADREVLRGDVAALLDGVEGDAAVRCYVTASGTHITTVAPQPDRSPARVLVPQPAPWIAPPETYGPAGAKTMSYMPNMVATRLAQRAGGDDALLVAIDGTVLEGPTFCVLWVVGGALHYVPVERGIVDSISRRTLLGLATELGITTREAEVPVDALGGASEVMICSSVRPVISIERVGPFRRTGPTPVADRLADALDAARRRRP